MGWTQCAGNHDIIITDTDLNKSPASWPLSAHSKILHLKEESALSFTNLHPKGDWKMQTFTSGLKNKYTMWF